MAGRRHHRSGARYRTARQRVQLKNAQAISAQKRRRTRRISVGIGTAVLAGGIAVGGVKYAKPKLKAKAAAYPYQKMNTNIKNTAKSVGKEHKAMQKKTGALKRRAELVSRNKARRQTPEQRAASRSARASYLAAYNDRRRAAYQQTRSVSGGIRPRKKRAKETKPRKRKTD